MSLEDGLGNVKRIELINMGPQFQVNAIHRSQIMGYTYGCKCPECNYVESLPANSFDFAPSNCPKCKISLEDPVFKESDQNKKYWLRVNVKWKRGFFGRKGRWVEVKNVPQIGTLDEYKEYHKKLESTKSK